MTTRREEPGVISTDIPALDAALGVGGLPRGKVIEFFGPDDGAKRTLALRTIGQVQRQGEVCAFIDAEHALDPAHAQQFGVRLDELLIAQPDCAELALEIITTLVRSQGVDLVVVDSASALIPKAEVEGELTAAQRAEQARVMSSALRTLTAAAAASCCCVLFLNHTQQSTPAIGSALRFFASVRLDVKAAGGRAWAKVVKNTVAAPFGVAEFDL